MFKIIIYLFIFFVFIIAFGLVAVLYGLYQFHSPVGGSEAKVIEIQSGETVNQIAEDLHGQNLIRSSFWFETYVWLTKSQNKLQAGKYSLSPNSSIVQIEEMISQGQVTENDIWVTIPEGFNLTQTQARLVEAGLDVAKGMDKVTTGDFASDYRFMSDAPPGRNLEGFLFPDTYKFKDDVSQQDIIMKMLDKIGRAHV